jgi:TRAP-type transport system periplasmic protein
MHRRLSRRYFLGALGGLAAPMSAFPHAAAAETYTMRLSLAVPPAGAEFQAAARLANAVARRTNGQLKIEVYPNSQIVSQGSIGDALVTGVLDLVISQAAIMESIMPPFQVFETPFLFKDIAAGGKALDGPFGAEMFAALEPKGMIGLAWGLNGFKQFETSNKAIVVPDDFKGVRMRSQNGAVSVAMYRALGALPVVIDVGETFVALQNHTIDGLDLSLDGFIARSMPTVVKHVAMSNHVLSVTPLLGSKRKIDALPAPLKAILLQEAKAVAPTWRSDLIAETAEYLKVLKQNAVAISEIQYPAFRKAMDPVYAIVQSKLGGLLERALRAGGAG